MRMMGVNMSNSRFWLKDDGRIAAKLDPSLLPLEEFLEDIGDIAVIWQHIFENVRNPSTEEWGGTGGDCTWISVRSSHVLIENQFNDQSVTLPRARFLEIAEEFLREITAARKKRQDNPKWSFGFNS